MRMTGKANILIPTHSQASDGSDIIQYSINRTIDCDFQALKYNVQFKTFGITDKTSNIMFATDLQLKKDFGLTPEIRIGFDEAQYTINSIIPYKKHIEVYLEKVI